MMSFKLRCESRIRLVLNAIILSLCTINTPVLASFIENDWSHNTVILRVWHSGLSNGDHYGHVSLETPTSYVSLWPSGEERVDLDIGCIKAKARFNNSYNDDLRDERRREEARYHLSLPSSPTLIDAELAQLQRRPLIWFALGTNTRMDEISRQMNSNPALKEVLRGLAENSDIFNCASIVHYLLRKGGLDLTDSTYLEVGSIHNPILQGVAISLATSSRSDIVNDIALLSDIIYPDKISYAAKRAMIDHFAKSVGYDLNSSLTYYLSNSSYTDDVYSTIVTSNFRRNDPRIRVAIKSLKERRDNEYPLKNCVLI